MGNFFAELKRRHIYRVAAAYAVVAWLLLQLVNTIAPLMRLPEWAGSFFLLLLIVGFPISLVFAWIGELKAPESTAGQRAASAGPLDWALMAALVAVLAAVSYQQFAPLQGARTAQQDQESVTAARSAAASPIGTISVAVLPFDNISGDADQEFFSDGITEEITAALAKVPDLRVVARTSAFQFKAQNRDIQSIGQQLHATHFIEGSVRKAGDHVRITAQLIKADDGTHLWSENYDRQLTDIFQVQEDIARAITTSLRMPLGLKPGENLVSNRKIDPESYQQYLRAKALTQGGGRQAYIDAAALLEQVVARNSEYAPAWALLGLDYAGVAFTAQVGALDESRRIVDTFAQKMEAAVRRAIQLDTDLPDGYAILATFEDARGKVVAAEDLLLKALALDPDNPDVLHNYSLLLAKVGRLKEAMPIRLKLQSVEPFVPAYNIRTAALLWVTGQNEAALAMLKAIPNRGGGRARSIARIYATTGRYGEAADALQGISAVFASPANVQEAVRLLRAGPASVSSTDNLRSLDRLSWVYVYVGAPEQSLQLQERMLDLGLLAGEEALEFWHSDYAPVRKTERFKTLMRKAGLVEYWRTRGWPDLCRPAGADDFVCD